MSGMFRRYQFGVFSLRPHVDLYLDGGHERLLRTASTDSVRKLEFGLKGTVNRPPHSSHAPSTT